MMQYDTIVVGGGHAGCEAALVSARRGARTLMIAISLAGIAQLPCNCSLGGPAKAQLTREIAALGGAMPRAADATMTHVRMLNTSKGPAVQAIRAQLDKKLYPLRMREMLAAEPLLTVLEGEVTALQTAEGAVTGVELADGTLAHAPTVILATGTFLNGITFIGDKTTAAGRFAEAPARFLSANLLAHGLRLGRLKTGTTPRLAHDSIDYSQCEEQPSASEKLRFQFGWQQPLDPEQAALPCYITHTDTRSHKIIRDNLQRSALYGGLISGRGPRYCPSIEDKVVRFAERERHQVFLEREGWDSPLVYPMGISTSMPLDVQQAFVAAIPGLHQARIVRPGYAVEYDFLPPEQLSLSLAVKSLRGLFAAGQINGSSGYEEAAAQGLIAGINAGQFLRGEEALVLTREQAYIGVLIDDLVSKGTSEPYRMLSSRAEHRLTLRQDNADLRLSDIGYRLGLLSEAHYQAFQQKRQSIEVEVQRLATTAPGCLGAKAAGVHNLYEWLRRPESRYADLQLVDPQAQLLPLEVTEQVTTIVKYQGYVARQQRRLAANSRLEERLIPEGFDYQQLRGLSREAVEHLTRVQPQSLGQAARIPGVTPADIALLHILLSARDRRLAVSRET